MRSVLNKVIWFTIIVLATTGIILCLFTSFSPVHAELLPVKSYTSTDGLIQNHVTRIVIDSRGYIWVCTNEGFSRFDGYKFTSFGVAEGLPHQTVNDLIETSAGDYWLATNRGLVRFDPSGLPRQPASMVANGKGPMFTVVPFPVSKQDFPVTRIVQGPKGDLWCGTGAGLFQIVKNGSDYSVLPSPLLSLDTDEYFVRSMLIDRQGIIWLGSNEGRLYRLHPNGKIDKFGAAEGMPDLEVSKLLEDREGRIWAGTGRGLFELDTRPDSPAKSIVKQTISILNGLPGDWIRDIWEAPDRTFWVATDRGLGKVAFSDDGRPRSISKYLKENGLSDYFIKSVVGDRAGNVWLGTANAGIMKWSVNGFTTHGYRDGIASAVSIFQNRAGEMFFSGFAPITYLPEGKSAGKALRNIPLLHWRIGRMEEGEIIWIRPNLPDNAYFSLGWNQVSFQDSRGDWWIATQQGLYRFSGAKKLEDLARLTPSAVYNTRNGLQKNHIYRLFEDSKGNIWITGTDKDTHTVDRWDRSTGRIEHISHVEGRAVLGNKQVTAYAEDRAGNIWLGLTHKIYPGGLARYRDGSITIFDEGHGGPKGNIFDLMVDSAGRLWAGSVSQGAIRIDDPAAPNPKFQYYGSAEGMLSNRVTSLGEDKFGRIYLATPKGVQRLNLEINRLRHFSHADGLALGNVDDILCDRNGDMWFATTQGISRFSPQPATPFSPPPVYIDKIRISGKLYPISALGETEVTLPDLGYNENRIEIEYVGLSYTLGDTLTYQAKLEKVDRDWGEQTYQRIINYANLAPGDYRLLVRAINARGENSANPACVSFTISEPFWYKWWFFVLIGALLAGMIGLIYAFRFIQKFKMQQMRMRLATDLHDDVGSDLSQIAIFSEIARRQLQEQGEGDPSPAMAPIEKVASISREAIDSMNDIVWSISPQRDHLRDLIQRMRHFASDTLSAVDIKLWFQAPEEDLTLKVDLRREVFMIFKECVNNIARHSQATEAHIELSLSAHYLTLHIRDNGRGFSLESIPDSQRGGNGLRSLRLRADNLGGTINIDSAPEKGTSITLRAPLRKR